MQKCFTKRIPGFSFLSYGERMKRLDLPSLELRRLHSDLVLCFKILNGLIVGPPCNYGLELAERQSRGHTKKLKTEHMRVNVRKFFFCNRVIEPWNFLPVEIINSNSIIIFKRLVKKCDLSKFVINWS